MRRGDSRGSNRRTSQTDSENAAIPAVSELLQVSMLTISNRSGAVPQKMPPIKERVQKTRSHEGREFTIKTKKTKTSASTGREVSGNGGGKGSSPFTLGEGESDEIKGNGRKRESELERGLVERRVKVKIKEEKGEGEGEGRKMGIKRKRTNAIKDFILETLNKAKAEGNCLVIHKGTAQLANSPPKPQHSPIPGNHS